MASTPAIGRLGSFKALCCVHPAGVVWFVRRGELWPVPRPAGSLLQSLLAGPTPAERAFGLRSMIPAGTRVLGVSVQRYPVPPNPANQPLVINLSSGFAAGGGTRDLQLRVGQLVATAGVAGLAYNGVVIQVDGKPEPFSTPVGTTVQTLDPQEFASLLPWGAVPLLEVGRRVDGRVGVMFFSGRGPLQGDTNDVQATAELINGRGRVVSRASTGGGCGPFVSCGGVEMPAPKVTRAQPGAFVLILAPSWWPGHTHVAVRVPVVLAPATRSVT